jgi:3-deoxy-D-manno-octulosonic-acid transferase
MRLFTALTLYRILLPLLFVAAFPGWIVKMLRRGGFGTHLAERISVYKIPVESEPCGAVHVHAVSVGEALLALKLIREWLVTEPGRRFVLATGTATGHAVATEARLPTLRVTYSPLDFRWMVRRYLKRFEPSQIILIEGEVWPHLLLDCKRRGIPVRLVNARMSPRSARRFNRFAAWLRPVYQLLDLVAIQEPEDAGIWQNLGLAPGKIHTTGSLKFDPGSGKSPTRRREFQDIIDAFGSGRKVILAASTFPGEDALIANAIRDALPDALVVLVPRHAERRGEVSGELEKAGFFVRLRSTAEGLPATDDRRYVLLIDSTGELSDWTAHADAVIIGKSFLSIGGQNPCEAILAEKPLILGPHMENFQALVARLVAANGCVSVSDASGLSTAILTATDPIRAEELTRNASALLTSHQGATRRILALLA